MNARQADLYVEPDSDGDFLLVANAKARRIIDAGFRDQKFVKWSRPRAPKASRKLASRYRYMHLAEGSGPGVMAMMCPYTTPGAR
jgi:hypothetical protein